MSEIKKTACHFCHMNCGMLATVENGVVTKVAGDPEHPFNAGAQCPRGASALDHLTHPNRINYPLKRVGERGSGQFKRVAWGEALDDIAARLAALKAEYGAETIATTGALTGLTILPGGAFFNLLGSPNVVHTAPVCWIPNFLTEAASYGWAAFDPEIMGAKCVVVWGHNPGASYLPEMRGLLQAKANGTKIIVIDPVYSETAAKADLWLPIRPGSDNALALAWLHVIINEGLCDYQFIDDWTVGFEELSDRVEEYTPDWAAEKTGISPELIMESARIYALSKPACIQWGVATDQLGRGSSASAQARVALRIICGNLDVPGGDVMPGPHPTFITDWELELNDMLPAEQRAKQLGSDRFKLNSWPGYQLLTDNMLRVWGKSIPAEWFCEANPSTVFRAMATGDPYPVKACIVLANNPLVSYANSKLVYKALKNLELLVAMEYWMTPSAMLADYVLPAASWLERPVMTTTYGVSDWLIASEKAIEPMFERRTDTEFWRELGLRLGQAEYWPWETDEEVFKYRLDPLGLELESYEEFVQCYRMHFAEREYQKYQTKGVATPSGKIELKISIFEQLGYDPLPHYVEPPFSHEARPELAAQYPLSLVAGGGFMPFFHSEHREMTRIRLLRPYPRVAINPALAQQLAIKEGDWLWIETPTGKVKQTAFITAAVAPDVVQAERGWWFPEKEVKDPELMGVFESNINVCVDDDPDTCDELCGSFCSPGHYVPDFESGGERLMHWGMLIDLKKCVGCHACTIACQNEHNLPFAMKYCKVAKVGPVGEYPNITAYNITTGCMHCADAPCVDGCPTGASRHRADGIVTVDPDKCVGCLFCMVVCPYGVRQLNEENGIVEKCTMCFNRLDEGLVTRCVETCQLQARSVGDLDDPDSELVKQIRKHNAQPLYSYLGTKPSIYYIMP